MTNSDGGIILDLRRGKIFRVNATGAMVVEHLVRGETEPRIAAEISRRSGADLAVASADVHEFLALLKSWGLFDRDDVH